MSDDSAPPPVDVPAARRRLSARFAAHHAALAQRVVDRTRRNAFWHLGSGARMAAALLIGAVGVTAAVWQSIHLSVSTPAFRDFATRPGNQATITLRDGTRLELGPASHIRIPADFGRRSRLVELDGEAYFAVVHDARHPFVVLTHNFQVNDVGTEFDVRAYDDDIRVAVARGSVVVGAGLRPSGRSPRGLPRPSFPQNTPPSFPQNTPPSFQDIPLSAGDMVDISNGVPLVTHHADIASATAWQQGRLVFEETPLADVAHTISRTFGVSVTIADTSLLTQRITASFTGQPLEVVLDEMTRVLSARYERRGASVVIRRRSASLDHAPDSTPHPLTTVQQ